MTFEPIAIVGRACVLPGALTPAELWSCVRDGRDLVGTAPAGRWRVDRTHVMGPPDGAVDRTWSDRGGYVEGFEAVFDPEGLAIPAAEILGLDPLVHWLLHVSREALREAKLSGSARAGAVFGNLSFPSTSMARYAERVWLGAALADAAGIASADPRDRFMSGLPAHLVARALRLDSGVFCLDAACASSLYAIKLACDRLHDRSADLMLAGGVNRVDDLFIHIGFCALQAMSRTGRSRPFHREADGLVPAEGAAVLALRRLADAEAAGDRILGVIRAVGLSNDGPGTGLLAPSSEGQVRAMWAAYTAAGLEPADVSLLECHATGTPVGDATEIKSMRQVFGDGDGIPIGSLKSNLGHSITVAGVAGLLKVLGAMEARLRPPTLHAEEPLEELAGSPFRLLQRAEPWESRCPRRAAVSAFGFGGNNAHLIVEEHQQPSSRRGARVEPAATLDAEVAIVAIGAAVGDGQTVTDFEAALWDPEARSHTRAGSLALPTTGLRFPPRDLLLALPEHTWTLAVAREALAGSAPMQGPRAGVFVGIGCSPEVARYGARWRISDWAGAFHVEAPDWVQDAGLAFAPPLEPAGVLGTMPNLPANRLNVQFDLRGPGYTVSAEELSGVRALELGARALRAGELDLALVCAADFSCEPVHESALQALGINRQPGDAAVAMVLKRASDARRDGDPVLALLEGIEETAIEFGPEEIELRFGFAHAAFGMVRVAAAALACARGRLPGGTAWEGPRSARLEIEALGGERAAITLRSGSEAVIPAPITSRQEGPSCEYLAHAPPVLLPPLFPAPAEPPSDDAPVRPLEPSHGSQAMLTAPELPPVYDSAEELVALETPPTSRPVTHSRVSSGPGLVCPRITRAAEQLVLLARAHRQFVEAQATVQQRFLELRERSTRALLRGARVPLAPGAHPPAVTPKTSSAWIWGGLDGRSPRRSESAGAPLSAGRPADDPAGLSLPGLKLDRRGLEVHASGRISEIFGPQFAEQDGYRLRVRMPEPPLLLADRLLGLDAEPGSLSKGRLWTETVVRPDAWYLHEQRMPAGLWVEAGQADLLLISYLGIDFFNRGQRVYRLLGCDLTFHGSLPVVGDTLRYQIDVDGHAQQGDIRLFFFHYDCRIGGELRLSVREGQAGFFSEDELSHSQGVLWDPLTAEKCDEVRQDPPAVCCQRSRFQRSHLEAFADGKLRECFGTGFEPASCHTRTPRLPAGRLLLLDEVTDFAPRGGPWARGYLRAIDRIEPDDWFFEGHFKDDPCMPGTLMFEGCLQAMSFYLVALGFTLNRDGWRFAPVPEETYRLRCRGQVTPRSRQLVYEIFVEEVSADPLPTLWADILCSVDGLKIFHCHRMGLRLVPGWPLDSRPDLVSGLVDRRPVASSGGFSFGAHSLLACAWGRPSDAFGPAYGVFDGPRRVPRLPGPPYHFMSRVTRIEGDMGAMQAGSAIEAECDVPPDAWYFGTDGARTMPFCVLLEAALQPCGWLASYLGSALTTSSDLAFRNLDGTGRLLAEVPPDAGMIRTRARVTSISQSAEMLIESFDVTCSVGDQSVFELKTAFGFFPGPALKDQRGLPVPPGQANAVSEPGGEVIDLRRRPEPWFGSGPWLGSPSLLMLDRVTGIWIDGGSAKLGRFRAETDVDPAAWFFKSHFFQDPVQPGSLGLEAMLQLLRFAMIRRGLVEGSFAQGRFEPIALGAPLIWKFRGQVLPSSQRVTTLLDLVRIEEDQHGRLAVASASLWVDGVRIYEASGLALRLLRPGPAARREQRFSRPAGGKVVDPDHELLDPSTQPWLRDHCPTWTVPALPLMSMIDRLAAAAARRAPGLRVVAVENARVHRWLVVPSPLRLQTRVEDAGDGAFDVELLAEEAGRSGFNLVASAHVCLASSYPAPDGPLWDPPSDARPVSSPYQRATLFHGPSWQLQRSLAMGATGSTATIDAGAAGEPRGLLHEALLDALTHGIPHDELSAWGPIDTDLVAYPHRVVSLRFHSRAPSTGLLRCETRFQGLEDDRFPRFLVQAITAEGLFASLDLVEVLLPKGPIGRATPRDRRGFLRDRELVPGLRLSSDDGETTRLTASAVRSSDWLPGTVAVAYSAGEDLLAEVAAKEHVAARLEVHPATVQVALGLGTARCPAEPLNARSISIEREGESVTVRGGALLPLDLEPVRRYWDRHFGIGRWPVEDLFFGLAEEFVRRVWLEDPDALEATRGRCLLYLSNHQVGIESLVFSLIAAGLTDVPTMTLAKAEHRQSWLGRLIQHAFTYPGVADPGVMTWFDRRAPGELPLVIAALGAELRSGRKSVMVHVEGTRSLSCRNPVVKMSGAFLDLAIATGSPVVPVRFVGGLPVEPPAARLEFPVGLGQQDILLGRPIKPEELSALAYKERKERVIGAINALGLPCLDEQPLPARPDFEAAVATWSQKTGASPEDAVIYQVLRRLPHPGEEIAQLLRGSAEGCLTTDDTPKGRWLAVLARRLSGHGGRP